MTIVSASITTAASRTVATHVSRNVWFIACPFPLEPTTPITGYGTSQARRQSPNDDESACCTALTGAQRMGGQVLNSGLNSTAGRGMMPAIDRPLRDLIGKSPQIDAL